MRNLEEFNNKHTGKTCFIIGSGVSILNHDISKLSEYVTIAVNSGIIAAPFADYFLSDDVSVKMWSYFHDLRSLKTQVLMYEDKLLSCENMFKERSVFYKHRRGYHLTKPYSHKIYEKALCECRTSVGSAIHTAYIMGCNPIVLVGIDCCRVDGKRYFWDFQKYEKPIRLDGGRTDRFKKITQDSDADLKEIMNYWTISSKHFLESCNVLNASEISIIDCFNKIAFDDAVLTGNKK